MNLLQAFKHKRIERSLKEKAKTKQDIYHETMPLPDNSWTVRVYSRKKGLVEEINNIPTKADCQEIALKLINKYEAN